jgi:hypothetical protein
MRRFLLPLRLFALLFQTAPPFPAAALLPSLSLLGIFIGLILCAAPNNVAITLAVASALVLRAWPKLRPTAAQIRKVTNGTTAAMTIGLCFALPMAFLLWQMDTRWSQHMVTLGPLAVALTRLIDIADGQYTAARMTWPDPESAWPMLTRVMFLSTLAFALLNETIMRTASLELWIAWFALMPNLSHYVTSALTTTVLLELNADT